MTITLKEAAGKLSEIIHKGAKGHEIVVTDENGDAFVIEVRQAVKKAKRERVFGCGKGSMKMGPKFDDPIPGLEPYMP